jgi:hypothetical protein
MERKKVYITVTTYPTISSKYDELVCTAGIMEDGSWIRLYPLPYRKLSNDKKYGKYQWIEVDVEKNTSDYRKESYKVLNRDSIQVYDQKKNSTLFWEERKRIIFKSQKAFTNFSELISLAKSDNISLAIFKPTKIIKFVHEEVEREWPQEKLEMLNSRAKQLSLFETEEEIIEQFKIVQKIPYKFFYIFQDDAGKESKLMIEDWEIGMLYLHCLAQANGNEVEALKKVKQKYFDEFTKKDLYFFVGTTLEFHRIAPNPFIIIGVFYPPLNKQKELF